MNTALQSAMAPSPMDTQKATSPTTANRPEGSARKLPLPFAAMATGFGPRCGIISHSASAPPATAMTVKCPTGATPMRTAI